MFPEYDKGIYIDSDIVVPGDISELYNIELGDNLIGACSDKSVVDVPELARYMEEAVGVSRYEYINSGVLLMNLKEMRKKEFSKKFLNLLNTYHFDCIAPDQDYLNAMCNGKILYLDEAWDAMPTEGKEPLDNPKLIHYNLFQKPWQTFATNYKSNSFNAYLRSFRYVFKRQLKRGRKKSNKAMPFTVNYNLLIGNNIFHNKRLKSLNGNVKRSNVWRFPDNFVHIVCVRWQYVDGALSTDTVLFVRYYDGNRSQLNISALYIFLCNKPFILRFR